MKVFLAILLLFLSVEISFGQEDLSEEIKVTRGMYYALTIDNGLNFFLLPSGYNAKYYVQYSEKLNEIQIFIGPQGFASYEKAKNEIERVREFLKSFPFKVSSNQYSIRAKFRNTDLIFRDGKYSEG